MGITIARNNGGNVWLHTEKYGLGSNGHPSLDFENSFGDFLDEAKPFSQNQIIFFPKYSPGLKVSGTPGSQRLLLAAR